MIAWLQEVWDRWMHGERPDDSKRSPHWHKIRTLHLLREPECQWCGGFDHLQAHHIRPFHLFPSRELDDGKDGSGKDGNLITLCEPPGPGGCHLLRGHRGNWKLWNPAIRAGCDAHRAEQLRGLAP